MKNGHDFSDILARLGAAQSIEDGLGRTLRLILGASGAAAGALVFSPARSEPFVVAASRGRPALAAWLEAEAARPPRGCRVIRSAVPGLPGRHAVLRAALGTPGEVVGALTLVGGRLSRATLPPGFPRELGAALERIWEVHRRVLRMRVLGEITRQGASSEPLAAVLAAFGDGLGELVRFDGAGVSLVDAERGEFTVVDASGRSSRLVPRRDARMPLGGTLLARVVEGGAPLRVDDLAAPAVPAASRAAFAARGYRSAVLAPLMVRGRVAGSLTVASSRRQAFDDTDVEIIAELAQPLAAAIEQRRLLEESTRRTGEMAALLQTSRLVSARLDLASVLEAISRAATALIGGTGCAIALLGADGRRLEHAAAHGFKSDEWPRLSIAVGEGIVGGCAETGEPARVGDVTRDPRSVGRDVDEREGIRSLLCVPMRAAGALIGVISVVSTTSGAFSVHDQALLEAFAEQAGLAVHNARLFEERVRLARETRALLEAGRAVTASLDVQATIRVIISEARSVLGAASCGLLTLDASTGDLVGTASLDLSAERLAQIRLKPGDGIGGRAFVERRPVQSEDLSRDSRQRFSELTSGTFRSMLAAPLCVGDRAIGVIYVFHSDVHCYSPDEEALLMAFADQAAIALEHARLYEQLEDVVTERTRELDEQKRFVEVVLETLPLGVFVLDATLRIVRVNGHGLRVLGSASPGGYRITELVPPEREASVIAFLVSAFGAQCVTSCDEEMTVAGEAKTFRLTAAPIESDVTHLVLVVEDVTLARRLERQMLLTERLTTAGRMASGVAHELNNPLATIAGCAEALLARTREAPLASAPAMDDFRHYLGLVEEEAYRCKEITGSLLQFVREPDSRRAPTDLNALVQKTVELLSHQKRFAGRRTQVEPSMDLPLVTLNESQLRQVFLGIASNALEAMDVDGTLTIRTRRLREEVEVEFEDAGPGIPDEILTRVFDPFFTTKPPGQGTGLGLAIAQGIVTDHRGRIEVTSRVGKGATFRVVLPL